jgi:hypothetical protein
MVDEKAPLARRLTAHGRILRRGRIFARLREGWAYDEIAAHERLTAERVRRIVRRALERRVLDDGAEHAKLQLTRLGPAMRGSGDAIAEGDVKAIGPLRGQQGRMPLATTAKSLKRLKTAMGGYWKKLAWIWVWRHVRLGLAPHRLGARAAPVWDRGHQQSGDFAPRLPHSFLTTECCRAFSTGFRASCCAASRAPAIGACGWRAA